MRKAKRLIFGMDNNLPPKSLFRKNKVSEFWVLSEWSKNLFWLNWDMCQLQENEEANPMTFSMSTYYTHMNEISIHRKNMGLAFSYFLAI